jgi:hypothetical protein
VIWPFFLFERHNSMGYARYLPLYQSALDLAVHLEGAVRRFARHHKYTLGTEPRHGTQHLCRPPTHARCGLLDATGAVVGAGTSSGTNTCTQNTIQNSLQRFPDKRLKLSKNEYCARQPAGGMNTFHP